MAKPNPIPARIAAATTAAAKTAVARDKKQLALDVLQAELSALEARLKVLDRVLAKKRSNVWCADLTEGARGEVATLELPDEGLLTLIKPGAPAPTAADGQLAEREAMTGAQLYWCAAALPGVQKWRPNYRRGTITALDAAKDLADVALDAADTSSAQGLGIHQTPVLAGVPVQYMTCNSRAFEVGDRCVVRFVDRKWTKPMVVGFESKPRGCGYGVNLIFWTDTEDAVSSINEGTAAGPRKYELMSPGRYEFVTTSAPECSAFEMAEQKIIDAKTEFIGSAIAPPYPVRWERNAKTYTVLSFVEKKPVMVCQEFTKLYTQGAGVTKNDNWERRTLMWGTSVLLDGTYVQDYRAAGSVITNYDTYNNYLDITWAEWGAVVGQKVTLSRFNDVPAYSAGASQYKQLVTSKPGAANLADITTDMWFTPHEVTVIAPPVGYPAGPGMNRHELDKFGNRVVTFDDKVVRACCRKSFYSWKTRPLLESIWVTRYDLGPSDPAFVNLPEIDAAYTHNCFFDQFIVSVTPGKDGFGFRLVVYGLDGEPVKKVTTDPPLSELDPDDGFTRVEVPGLANTARLVGAMRDETACM